MHTILAVLSEHQVIMKHLICVYLLLYAGKIKTIHCLMYICVVCVCDLYI